jgi:hypothetical protein
MKCGFRDISFLEIDEIFKFLDRDHEARITKKDFLKVFGDWKPLDPVEFNRKYFEKLSARQLNYYKRTHYIDLNDKKRANRARDKQMYDREDDEFFDIYQRHED